MEMNKKLISIVTPCYNEAANLENLCREVKHVFDALPEYEYEHIIIDNCSLDNSVAILRKMAMEDENIKVILNTRNFGQIRSPHHAILQAKGNAIISIVADFQDPPGMIPVFLAKWEEGFKIVIGIKKKSEENFLMFGIRKMFYNLLSRFSDIELIKNFTGFGLYDRSFIDIVSKLDDPYPYFRGLIPEFGLSRYEIDYEQPKRKKGKTSQNFLSLYEVAMLGFVNYTKIALRMASFIGIIVASLSLLVALGYFVYKLLFWYRFDVGLAPLVIGLFFFSAVQLVFIGVIGEYVGAIFTQIKKRPLVIEKERINF